MKPYIGPSEAQSNADALARRDSTWSGPSEQSFRVQWDVHRREPVDLHEAVDRVRRAYADEVPDKLHDGPDAIGDDGTPRMTAKAVGYIFGNPQADDAGRDPETGQRDLSGWHYTPFRAELARLLGERRRSDGALEFIAHDAHPEEYVCDDPEHKRGLIVQHVAIGSMGPQRAAIEEGVPRWCAKTVAEDVLRAFLHGMTDLRLHPRSVREASEGVA